MTEITDGPEPDLPAHFRREQQELAAAGFRVQEMSRQEYFTRLLALPGYPLSKVDVLRGVQNTRDPYYLEAVRLHVTRETDPLVLASLVIFLAAAGDAGDVERLLPMLDHADPRVIAAALEAWTELAISGPPPGLSQLLSHTDLRVRTLAMSILGKLEPQKILMEVPAMMRSPHSAVRGAGGFLLGQLGGYPDGFKLLLKSLRDEEHIGVFELLGKSLLANVWSGNAGQVAGHLEAMRRRSPGKESVAQELLKQVSILQGWMAGEASQVAEEYLKEHPSLLALDPEPVPGLPAGAPRKTLRAFALPVARRPLPPPANLEVTVDTPAEPTPRRPLPPPANLELTVDTPAEPPPLPPERRPLPPPADLEVTTDTPPPPPLPGDEELKPRVVWGYEDSTGTMESSIRKTRKTLRLVAQEQAQSRARLGLTAALMVGALVPAGLVGWRLSQDPVPRERTRVTDVTSSGDPSPARASRRHPAPPASAAPSAPLPGPGGLLEVYCQLVAIAPTRAIFRDGASMIICPEPADLDLQVGSWMKVSGKVASEPRPGWAVLSEWTTTVDLVSLLPVPHPIEVPELLNDFRFGGGGAPEEDPAVERARAFIEYAGGRIFGPTAGDPSREPWLLDPRGRDLPLPLRREE